MAGQQSAVSLNPDSIFSEDFVEADGFRIRYREAGEGDVLVYLHGGGGLRLSGAHEILARDRRVIAFETPGFGDSPANDRSATMEELASSMNEAVSALGIERYSLMGNSFGGKLALWMAITRPAGVESMVLVAPAAIRLGGGSPAAASPEEQAALLYAHPERHPPIEPLPAEIAQKQLALTARLIGPPRDEAFEARLGELEMQVLALFGTEDRVIPPEVAHFYRELLPYCHLMMVYEAAHAVDADRPEAVASVVEDFLNRHEQFLVRQKSDLIHP